MNREIKFKGKRPNGKWKVSRSIVQRLDERILLGGYIVWPETVCQFTGLFDKNGKEIYEGDILQNTPREVQYKVYWSKDMHAWFVERINYGSKEPLCCLDDKFEVIGSIYDTSN